MRIFGKPWFCLPRMAAIAAISTLTACVQPSLSTRAAPLKVGHVPVAKLLQLLGAELEGGAVAKDIDAYSSHFDRTDPNRDGKHTRAEYVDKGTFMTPQARAGIFEPPTGTPTVSSPKTNTS